MKSILLNALIAAMLFIMPNVSFGQAPTLGNAANFVLFSTNGSVSNSGISHLTGNVGTNNGSSTAFGNVNGGMHDQDSLSARCAADLLIVYNQLNATTATFFPAPLLGNGDTLNAGVYSISGSTTLNLNLFLNAKGNANAVFIFKIQGSFSTSAFAKIKLINGAQACNVFWKVEGLVSMATGTSMKGTVIANNAAINMNTGDTLEGRALSTAGAVTVNGVLAYTPIGCGSKILNGPIAPTLGTAACYAIFSSNGAVSNSGVTHVIGDIGSNNGSATGYNPLFVTGTIHSIPDTSTAHCAADLLTAYNYINKLPYDIELLYPAQFGRNLVLTPHTYIMKGAATFTDTLYLNAMGNANAVFVIQINGALSTSTYSKVLLINGALAQNVYWKVEGAVSINNYSIFNGTIICNNGALGALNTGVVLNGRALTTAGALSSTAMDATITSGCSASAPHITTQPNSQVTCAGNSASYTVAATGVNLTYQWRKGAVNLSNSGNISGATSATLTINPANVADASANYNVLVSGSTAPKDSSINVSLTINTAPNIATQPSNQTACPGTIVSYSVVANGAGLTYQWRKGAVNLSNGGNISGATSAVLTINPANVADTSSNYNVVVSGTCTPMSTSINVSLMINTAPNITSNPTNQIACSGNSASFSVSAGGTSITYQWKKGAVNLSNGGNISGATSAKLTINPVSISDSSSLYNVVVTGTCSPVSTSINASLLVNIAPGIISNPANQVICNGSSANFSVTAKGSGLTYQWRKGAVNLSNAGNISGANTATLTLNSVSILDTASNYNVVVTGSCSPISTSLNASLILSVIPKITSDVTNQRACAGSSANFSVTAEGSGLTYQWRKGAVNLSNAGNISGATSAMLTINPVSISDTASNYNVVITGTCSSTSNTSTNAFLMLNTSPAITKNPANQIACVGSSVSFSVAATGTALTYQWRKGVTNLSNGGNITGATTATLTLDPMAISDTASNYSVIIMGACAPISPSTSVSLSVCSGTGIAYLNTNMDLNVYPNPFTTSIDITINEKSLVDKIVELKLYNLLGAEVVNTIISKNSTKIDTSELPSGIYFYKIISNNKTIQTGKLVSAKQ